jgi:deazaflavin-dependent oxidoreductase (nitroreductase family)
MTRIFQRLTRLQNPFMKWLLRSPFHCLVSRFYMIIIVTGRKTGQQYETPVQYHQEGQTLWIVTSEQYKWWRNLRGGAPVQVYLRGHTYEGCATPFTENAAVLAALKRIYPSFSDARSEQIAAGAVALELQLQPQPQP